MFDFFDASKLIVVGIIALIFIGPKELPGVLRQVGQFVAKMRRMAAEFQGQFMDAMKEADVANLKQDFVSLNETARKSFDFNPVADIKNDILSAVNPVAVPAPPLALNLPPVAEMPPPVIVAPESAAPKTTRPKRRAQPAAQIDETPKPRARAPRKSRAVAGLNGHGVSDPDDRQA